MGLISYALVLQGDLPQLKHLRITLVEKIGLIPIAEKLSMPFTRDEARVHFGPYFDSDIFVERTFYQDIESLLAFGDISIGHIAVASLREDLDAVKELLKNSWSLNRGMLECFPEKYEKLVVGGNGNQRRYRQPIIPAQSEADVGRLVRLYFSLSDFDLDRQLKRTKNVRAELEDIFKK